LRTIAVRCGALRCMRKRCRNLADHWNASKPLRFTTMHCGAISAHCNGVHHTRNSLTIMVVHYGNVTESLGTTGTLADHCDALRCIAVQCASAVQIAHAAADCLIHDLLFLPISIIESAVGKRLTTHCCVPRLACSRLSGHIEPHSPDFKREINTTTTVMN